jgi:hypothetical protein
MRDEILILPEDNEADDVRNICAAFLHSCRYKVSTIDRGCVARYTRVVSPRSSHGVWSDMVQDGDDSTLDPRPRLESVEFDRGMLRYRSDVILESRLNHQAAHILTT